ncbi:MAG: DUF4190 domain-containing protein [Nanoarchaeota archaeon]|nr:DUF4190 domain-containing protein [Nanoarchaeota archaeon]
MATKLPTASLVIGILAFILGWLPVLGWGIVLLGLVLSIVSLVRISKDNSLEGKGFAIAGLVLSSIGLLFTIYTSLIAFMYLGILDTGKIIPESCSFTPPGIDCLQNAATTSNTMTLVIRNGSGFGIILDSIESSCTGPVEVRNETTQAFSKLEQADFQDNEMLIIRMNGCDYGKSGSRVNEELSLKYVRKGSMIPRTATGRIRSVVN